MRKLFTLRYLLPVLILGMTAPVTLGQTTVFSDDFSTSNSTTYTTSGAIGGSAWTVLTGGSVGQDFGARRNTSPAQLELTNDATANTNVNGWVLASTSTTSFLSPYTTTLSSNPGNVIWTFNMRQIRPDPAGFGAGSYGVAYILSGTSTTNNNTGSGYAIVLGQSLAVDPVRLIKYSAGIQGPITNIITSNTTGLTDFGAEYLSIKVVYTASTNTWELFLRNDGASAFADPAAGTLTSQGTAVDNTYTGIALNLMGAWWQGSTTAAQTAFFDNVKVAVAPLTPTISSISPSSAETGGPNFTLTVNGTNFVNGVSVVKWNGSDRATSFVTATQLTATILSSDITTAGSATVEVNNPGASPATSNSVSFAINAPAGTPTLTATTLADFGNVCINTTAGPNSFSLDGNNLNGSNSSTISVSALPGFTYSETENGTYTNTLNFTYTGTSFTGKIIYVKFTPTAVQSYNGNIAVSGGGVANHDVPASGAGVNSAASVTTGGSSNVTPTSATISATLNGGCSAQTNYGFFYSLNSGFPNGQGTRVSASNLSSGTFSVNLTGLDPNARYYYKAYTTNGTDTAYGLQDAFTNPPLPVSMASQPGLTFTEDFHDIANWTNFFIAGTGANHFDGLSVSGSGVIPNGTNLTTSTTSFQGGSPSSPSTSGGVHKGTNQPTPTQSIVLLSTGSGDNTSSAAIDFYMDFTGVNAGTLSFDWASVNNSTGDRNGSMRVYYSTNGIAFTELTAAAVLNFTNNLPTSGSQSNIALPAAFNNSATAILRFYYYNGTGGITPTGSRPKLSIDNLTVTAVPSTPCSTPTAQPTSMVFGTKTDVSIQGSFTAASPSSDQYLTVASTSNSLTSDPIDGVIYNVGDALGDGTVIAKGSTVNFTATGLSPSTTYYFFTFAVNGVCTGGPKYLTTNPLTGSTATNAALPNCAAPSSQATSLVFGTTTTNSIQASFTATTADEYLVLKSSSSSLSQLPVNGQLYNAGDAIGNAIVIQRNGSVTFTASGLSPETQYYFYIFSSNSLNCVNGPVYNTDQPLTGDHATQPLPPCTTPTAQPTTLSLSAANTSISGAFSASGSADAYVVIRSTSSSYSSTPANNTDYAVGSVIGDGVVVSNSSATSFITKNLNPNTTYYFYVFAANKNCSGGTKYLTASPLTGNATTTNALVNNYYFGSLHSHSDYSDGNKDHPGYTPAKDYEYAMTAQCMDFLGISEHNHFSSPDNPGNTITNYMKGPVQADSFTNVHPNFLALYGMEWGVINNGGHVVIYGDGMNKLYGWESGSGGWGPTNNYDVYVPKSVYTGSTGLFKTIQNDSAYNTFATLAHPNSTDYNNIANIAYDPTADYAIVGSAVASGPAFSTNTTYSDPSSMNYLWYYQTMLSKGYHLGPTIDHDNHNTTFGKTAASRTAVIAPTLSKTDFVKAMRDMHFYATEDCDTKVDFTVNARIMGSVFSDRNAPVISVTLTDLTTSTSSAIIRIISGRPGSGIMPVKIDSAIGNTLYFVDNSLANGETAYYYADINNGTARIVTSPIWYTRTCSNSTTTDTATACDSYTWHGTTYTTSGDYTYESQNAEGCTNVATLHLTIEDTEDPTITAPSNVAVNTDNGSCSATNVSLGTPTTADNCGVATVTNDAPSSFPYGETTVTWTVTDTHGRTATATQTVTVTDNQDPIITAPSNVSVNADNGSCSATGVSLGTPSTSDNCGVADVSNDAPSSYPVGETTVTWTVTDTHGRTATATQTVTVTDNQDPIITAPSNVAVNADNGSCSATGVSLGTPSTSDNCGVANVSNDAPSSYPVGETTVTWTVTDTHGRTATATQTVTVTDNQDPMITAPSNVAVNADNGSCSATGVSLGTPSTSDNCGVANVSNNAPSSYPVGETTVTWTVTDTHGRTATATQTVTVTDNQDPTITAPSNVSVNADNGSCSATNVSLGTPTTGDNCGVAGVTNDHSSTTYPVGVTTVTWTVTDVHGRTATATQTVTVTDNQNPTITCVANQTRLVNNAGCTYKVAGSEFDPTAFADNCPGATVTNNFNNSNTLANALFPKGNTVVTWTVNDAHGNSSTCTTTITVNSSLASSVADVYAVQPGGAANTIYIGYGPSSVTLHATVTGGTAPYSYKWTVGSNAGAGINTTANLTVSPTSTTTYYLNVKDVYGCTVAFVTKTIEVVDVRCGPKKDKVTVCVYNKGSYSTNCVTSNSVSGYLSNGSYLGACTTTLISSARTASPEPEAISILPQPVTENFNVKVSPNPSTTDFKLLVQSNSNEAITIRLQDVSGRVIGTVRNVKNNQTVTVGNRFIAGTYFAEVIQESNRKVIRLIKLN